MLAANASATDRQVVLPKGAVISIMPTTFTGLKNVQLTIDGTLLVSKNFKQYPQRDQVIQWERCEDVLVDGKGMYDG